MKINFKKMMALMVTLAALLCLSFAFRGPAILTLVSGFVSFNPALLAKGPVAENVRWIDDYYTVEYLDKNTIAIGEPRYHQKNYSYLIIGSTGAVLYDNGSGTRKIRRIVKKLTDRKITTVLSHLHYDHLGNTGEFDDIALLDETRLKKLVKNGEFTPTKDQHLGHIEGISRPSFSVSRWLRHGEIIDLGNRKLRVLHTPGHTEESISLYDKNNKMLFGGDFMYPGTLYAFLPGSSPSAYLKACNRLLKLVSPDTKLYLAHSSPMVKKGVAPELGYKDIRDLARALRGIKKGSQPWEGLFLRNYIVNERVSFLCDYPWNISWE